MQRVLCMKLLTKAITSCKIDPIPVKIPPKTANALPPIRHLFSEYSTCSYSPPNRAFSDKISYGFFSNPFLANHFLRKATLKDLSKNIFNGTVGFSRFQLSKRISHSVDVTRRSWAYWFQRLTVDGVVWGLISANVAVFLLWRLADREFMMKNFMISVENIRSGKLHTLITSAFSHTDIFHLGCNMLGLYFFGNHIGSVLGAKSLLRLYFTGALAGSVFFLVYHAFFAPSLERSRTGWIDSSRFLGLGASGAVNAIMLLDIFLFPKKIIYLEFIIPVPAMLLGIFIIGNDLRRAIKGDSDISGSAHLGGAAVAALAWYKVRRGRFRF